MSRSREPRKRAVARHGFDDKSRGVRLQKVLADAGVAARRECEALVVEGSVTVNGTVVDSLPAWVDPALDRIEVHGRPIRRPERHVYVMLFKPRGTVCTNSDPEGRPRAIDLVRHPDRPRLYCVGRLDLDSSGLLLLTNDGDFANRLTHPRYGVTKGYDVVLGGSLGDAEIRRLEREIFAADGRSGDHASSLRLVKRERDRTLVHLELREHRNLQLRPLMVELGHPVKKLRRTSFGPLKLKGLGVGEWRDLTSGELDLLRRASRGKDAGSAIAPKAPRRSMEELAAAREARAAAGDAASDAVAAGPAPKPGRPVEAPPVRRPHPTRSGTKSPRPEPRPEPRQEPRPEPRRKPRPEPRGQPRDRAAQAARSGSAGKKPAKPFRGGARTKGRGRR